MRTLSITESTQVSGGNLKVLAGLATTVIAFGLVSLYTVNLFERINRFEEIDGFAGELNFGPAPAWASFGAHYATQAMQIFS